MKTPLTILNLVHEKVRTVVAILGISFAIILVFMQLGFYGSVEATATLLYDKLEFDLILVSSEFIDLTRADTIPLVRLEQTRALQSVDSVTPLYVGFQLWRNPETRRRRTIMVLGCQLADQVFRLPEVTAAAAQLQLPERVLIDRRSRKDFGPQATGTKTEIGTREVTIVGQFTMGGGFAAEGTLICSQETFTNIFAGFPKEHASMGLVKLRPGVSAAEAAAELGQVLPTDVKVWTRQALESYARRHWVKNTSIGIIFGLGVLVVLLVGMVFVYQVISSDITRHLAEYATLKAMGYRHAYMSRIVLDQALILSVVSFVPGLLVSLLLYEVTLRTARIPIGMTWQRVITVGILTVAMCSLSGVFALKKVKSADPADLF